MPNLEEPPKSTLPPGSGATGMLLFALPIFVSNLFQQLYNAADSLIVGNFLGGEALAAVGSSGSLIFLLTGFVNGVSLGAGVVVARYFGAKDWERMRRTIHTTVALGRVAGVVPTAVGGLLTPQILRWMGTPADVLVNSVAYFRMYFMGSIAVVMYNVGASILQSVGDSKSPMRYLITASIINIILDLVLVGWLRMGVAAAAFATIASQTVSAILAFAKLMRSQEAWAVRWQEIRFDSPSLKAVIMQGLPSGVQNSVISIANVIVQSNINAFGAQAMAGCGAYSKVEGFAFLPVTSFSMALAPFGRQNVGGVLSMMLRHQPLAVPPVFADDVIDDGLVCAAHHLHHHHAAFHPQNRRCVLGLPADMEYLVRAVCLVHSALPNSQNRRRRTGGIKGKALGQWRLPPWGKQSATPTAD